ncbi:MAG TPA: hypothetical protein DDW86_00265 [Clostridiales bacterium]|nr:hypothetical protein [Clostridiales bacterium]
MLAVPGESKRWRKTFPLKKINIDNVFCPDIINMSKLSGRTLKLFRVSNQYRTGSERQNKGNPITGKKCFSRSEVAK